MNMKTLGKISKWMNKTDLEEVTWRKGKDKMSIKLNNSSAPSYKVSAHSKLVPVNSPAVGIFRFSKRGKSFAPEEGSEVKKGQELGVIEIGKNSKPIKSEENGLIKIICVEDGKTVEYGQPLFFVEPK